MNCKYDNRGLADVDEFVDSLNSLNIGLSPRSVEMLLSCIKSKKNETFVSLIKVQQFIEDVVYQFQKNPKYDSKRIYEILTGRYKETNLQRTPSDPLVANYLRQIQLRIEEKCRN